jgi:hypothetical protein
VRRRGSGAPSPGADLQALLRCRCGRAEPSPGADVAAVSPVRIQMRQGVSPVPVPKHAWTTCGSACPGSARSGIPGSHCRSSKRPPSRSATASVAIARPHDARTCAEATKSARRGRRRRYASNRARTRPSTGARSTMYSYICNYSVAMACNRKPTCSTNEPGVLSAKYVTSSDTCCTRSAASDEAVRCRLPPRCRQRRAQSRRRCGQG